MEIFINLNLDCYSVFNLDHKKRARYIDSREFSSPNSFFNSLPMSDEETILKNIYSHIENAVIKRVDNTEEKLLVCYQVV